jgi:hypothetical protein
MQCNLGKFCGKDNCDFKKNPHKNPQPKKLARLYPTKLRRLEGCKENETKNLDDNAYRPSFD